MIGRSGFFVWLAVILLAAFAFGGCGCGDDDDDSSSHDNVDDDTDDDSDDDSTDDDAGDDDTFPPLPDDDTQTEEPWDNLSDALGAGEVRAGVVATADELLTGPRARGAVGDFKMYNSKVAFIVRAPGHGGAGWTKAVGNIIDADRVRPAGEPGQDGLWSIEHLLGILRAFDGTRVTVLENGRSGRVVVQVEGRDIGIDIADEVVHTWDRRLVFVNQYILEPDADYVKIESFVTNNTGEAQELIVADAPMWGDHCPVFSPAAGSETGSADLFSGLRWVGGMCKPPMRLSYALVTTSAERRFWAPYLDDEVLPLFQGKFKVEPGETKKFGRYLVVDDGGSQAIESLLADEDGRAGYGTLTGSVELSGSDTADDLQIIVRDSRPGDLNYHGVIRPASDGTFSATLPADDYELSVVGETRSSSAPVSASVTDGGTENVSLPLDALAFVHYTVTDESDDPVPCKLTFQPGFDAVPGAGVSYRIFSINGSGTEAVPPGDYTVTISRGNEYEIDVHNLTVTEGGTAELVGDIQRVVDSTGWMTGDFHIHTEYSIDSQAAATTRMKEFAAEGLEMPVVTDHDTRSDYWALSQLMDAQAWVHPVIGSEVSPIIGHTNLWPLTGLRDDLNDYYGVPLVKYDENGTVEHTYQFGDLWTIARDAFGAEIAQVNHPRDSTGWFDWLGYDPAIGISSAVPNRWDPNFEAIEVFNSGANDMGALADWFSFLDQGYIYTMTGNSDTHGVGNPPGDPRNVFAMPGDDPETADPEDMVDSILHHRSFVSDGPFVTVHAGDAGMGDVYDASTDGIVPLSIKVQAPSWILINYLRVYTNHGQVIVDMPLAETTDVLRYDDTIPVDLSDDAYLVVEVGHTSARLVPVINERVFAFTNPIFVDTDGNGEFDPPGLP